MKVVSFVPSASSDTEIESGGKNEAQSPVFRDISSFAVNITFVIYSFSLIIFEGSEKFTILSPFLSKPASAVEYSDVSTSEYSAGLNLPEIALPSAFTVNTFTFPTSELS